MMVNNTSAREGESVDDGYSVELKWTWATLTMIVCAFSIMGNLSLIVVILRTRALKTFTNAFILSLAIGDFLKGVMLMPFIAISYITGDGLYVPGFCQLTAYLLMVFETSSMLTLTLVSFDRCIAVASPLKYTIRITWKSTFLSIIYVWIQAVIFALPPVFGHGTYAFHQDIAQCTLDLNDQTVYIIIKEVFCKFIPGVLITVLLMLIIRAAYAQRRIMSLMTMTIGVTLGLTMHNQPPTNYRRTTLAAMRNLFFMIFALCLLWTPYTIVRILELPQHSNIPRVLVTFTSWLNLLASAVNPVIFLTNKKFNKRFRELYCSSKCRNRSVAPSAELTQSTYLTRDHTTHVDREERSQMELQEISEAPQRPTLQYIVDVKSNTLNIPTVVSTNLPPIKSHRQLQLIPQKDSLASSSQSESIQQPPKSVLFPHSLQMKQNDVIDLVNQETAMEENKQSEVKQIILDGSERFINTMFNDEIPTVVSPILPPIKGHRQPQFIPQKGSLAQASTSQHDSIQQSPKNVLFPRSIQMKQNYVIDLVHQEKPMEENNPSEVKQIILDGSERFINTTFDNKIEVSKNKGESEIQTQDNSDYIDVVSIRVPEWTCSSKSQGNNSESSLLSGDHSWLSKQKNHRADSRRRSQKASSANRHFTLY